MCGAWWAYTCNKYGTLPHTHIILLPVLCRPAGIVTCMEHTYCPSTYQKHLKAVNRVKKCVYIYHIYLHQLCCADISYKVLRQKLKVAGWYSTTIYHDLTTFKDMIMLYPYQQLAFLGKDKFDPAILPEF